MKRIVIITHGDLCQGFLSAMQILNGEFTNIETLSLHAQETIEGMTEQLQQLLSSYSLDDTVVILTDIAIGTTTKCIFPLLPQRNCYIISGCNLPLLLSVYLSDLGKDPYTSLQQIVHECKESILFINEVIQEQEKGG